MHDGKWTAMVDEWMDGWEAALARLLQVKQGINIIDKGTREFSSNS